MAKLSKPFRIATEGATCDGRTISRQDIVDMAATYRTQTYAARVNMEHLRGYTPGGDFGAYGDVVALSTQEIELEVGGKKEKRLALLGQVDALDNLMQLNGKGQKLYPSIEINPNFADSGKAYLQGLAMTDSPASLGTEIMQFAAGAGEANPFTKRKQAPGNFFSAVDEGVILEFADEAAGDPPSDITSAVGTILAFFSGRSKQAPETPATPPAPPAPPEPANDNEFNRQMGALVTTVQNLSTKLDGFATRFTKLEQDHAALQTSVENTDSGTPRRPAADGRGNYARADF
ncbi:GPO family capsid scaffolding protein [Sphingomonas sp. PL-96]|uniref:GPO family capsid scaffolding protein n=1 Tax=Sphingomonas sp. PL-96 TaxID=2887201 RepID=UPI001E653846|nr:GPO family capsid scaffolding protein [Sphingomonas sp. PL-96]MCC2976257.1 GPO family capsid scaffolding protein [Sphingomonas sp. PL-96]